MKSILFIALVAMTTIFASCNSKPSTEGTTDSTAVSADTTMVAPMDSSATSADTTATDSVK
jgi:hypothetical protein